GKGSAHLLAKQEPGLFLARLQVVDGHELPLPGQENVVPDDGGPTHGHPRLELPYDGASMRHRQHHRPAVAPRPTRHHRPSPAPRGGLTLGLIHSGRPVAASRAKSWPPPDPTTTVPAMSGRASMA